MDKKNSKKSSHLNKSAMQFYSRKFSLEPSPQKFFKLLNIILLNSFSAKSAQINSYCLKPTNCDNTSNGKPIFENLSLGAALGESHSY